MEQHQPRRAPHRGRPRVSPRRRSRWPWPADTALDRREAIARAYRVALRRVDQAAADHLDGIAVAVGQSWILSTRRALPADELLDTAAVADHFDVTARLVDQWRDRDGLRAVRTADGVRYRYGDVVAFLAARRHRRAAAAAAAQQPDTPVDDEAAPVTGTR